MNWHDSERHVPADGCDNALPKSPPGTCSDAGPSCGACGVHPCPGEEPPAGQFAGGWRFGAAALGVFATPLVLALAGATWFRRNPDHAMAAAVGGLCLGMTIAALVSRMLQRKIEVHS